MGWSAGEDGGLYGDGPADAISDRFKGIAEEAKRRTGGLPTGLSVLHSFVCALNLDGSLAPFYAEKSRLLALVVSRAGQRLRIDGTESEPWLVASLYEALDEVAESYVNSWSRPPQLQELLPYVATELSTWGSDEEPWDLLGDAKFRMSQARKGRDRSPAPEVPDASPPQGRVKHPKFGDGVIVSEQGDRLTIQFENERRVLLRSFVTRGD
jgi:hypothetical protein